MSDDHAAYEPPLRRIADILGVPVEDLYRGAEPQHLWASGECLRLWYTLKTDVGRNAALDALRKVLDDEGA